MSVKITKNTYNMGRLGRNLLPLKDLKTVSDYLFKVGSKDPPFKVRDFIQDIRRDDTPDQETGRKKKMSYEYKILAKLCPAYGKRTDRIINKLYPFDAYSNIDEAKNLWIGAFVKLGLPMTTRVFCVI